MIDWSKRAQPTLAADDIVGFDDYGKTFFACEVRRDQDPPLDGQLDPNLFRRPEADWSLLSALMAPVPRGHGPDHGFSLARSN